MYVNITPVIALSIFIPVGVTLEVEVDDKGIGDTGVAGGET